MSFYLSKLLQRFIDPSNTFAVLLLVAAIMMIVPRKGIRHFGRWLVLVLAVLLFLTCMLPVGDWALAPLENKYVAAQLPDKVDGLIMLTGDENPNLMEARGGLPTPGHAGLRYLELGRLAKRYPHAKIVLAGTTAPLCPSYVYTTKDLSQALLDGLGIDRKRVVFEEQSRTTRENATLSYELAKPKPGETWVLVTSAFHMPRAYLSFKKIGWDVVPRSADFLTTGRYALTIAPHLTHQMRLLSIAAHEAFGLIAYWMSGWIERPW